MPTSTLGRYSHLLYTYPSIFLIVPLVLTGILPILSLKFAPVQLTNNAEVGFDTKDTDYSGPRIAWRQLQSWLSTTNRIPFTNTPTQPSNSSLLLLTHNNVSTTRTTATTNGKRSKRGWADDLLFAVQNVPCYDAPIPLMNHLAQFVVEIPSFDDVFSYSFLQDMCYLQGNASEALKTFDPYTPYRNVWSISNFISCLSPNLLVNCTQLTHEDVRIVRDSITQCSAFRRQLIKCKVDCQEQCTSCPGVPSNCSSQMMFDLFYRLLPMDLSAKPFLVNTFLPAFTLTGYATQNIQIPLKLYDGLEKSLMDYTSKRHLKIKGILMDVKRERLLAAAMSDSLLALLAAALIMSIIALHSRSILYAIAVFIVLALSVSGALAIYAWFTPDFPLLNLVIFVLLIAVGTDDAFLLFSNFPEDLNEQSFHHCLVHTGATMFLTSFSTAVPFFVNVLSNVIVFRCFGLFAGVTTVINWFLVVSFLPAFLILQRRYFSCIPSIPNLGNFCQYSVQHVLPSVLIQGRLVWLSSLLFAVIGATFIVFVDLHLPEYNPLQLFVSSNLHEWYDNNAEQNFEFVASKIAMPLMARLVWGVQKSESLARFQADANSHLKYDPSFSLKTTSDVYNLASSLEKARHLPFVNQTAKFWPERFLEWSDSYPCSEGFLCCNMSSPIFSETYLDYCLRNSTGYLPTSYNDTPIFDNRTFMLTGYTALIPTSLKYSHRFSKLNKAFDKLAKTHPVGGWWAPEWPLMSTWFDLQRSIISDCRYSVVISIIVVSIFAAAQLKLQALPAVATCICIILTAAGIVVALGWVLGVLEAVILVLVVGLSFDYTLHYGAALPPDGCPEHRVRHASEVALAPVSLAAFTSFLAGASMLFSQTHAFFQVGTFLVVVTSTSWLFATFFFLPLLTFTLPHVAHCSQCEVPSQYAMQHKY